MHFRESPEFLRGRDAEQMFSRYLKCRGWYIIPACDYSGSDGNKAPMLQGDRQQIVLPDLIAAGKGHTKMAEVKAKKEATFTRKTGQYEHGIGIKKWMHYLRVERETGCQVWLAIIEGKKQMLLMEHLKVLGDGRIYEGNKMDPGGMVFWSREAFRHRETLNSIPGLFDPQMPIPFDTE